MSLPRALLVEDDEDDAFLMLRAGEGFLELERVADGAAALARLRPGPSRGAAALPALVLLDWRLPGLSGEEVLRGLRSDPTLRLLPVLVLTTSAAEADARAAYAAGANAFLTKPNGGEALRALVGAIAGFWLRPEIMKITPRGE